MKTRLLISLALPILLASVVAASAADLAPLVKATRRIARDSNSVTVVWWLPPAFIDGLMAQAQTPTSGFEHQALAALHDYALFALLHVSRDQSGTLVPASRDEVLMNARLEVHGKTLDALTPGQISPLAAQILAGMQRGLIRSMGLNGQALYIVAYPAERNGLPLFNPKSSTQFRFQLYGHDFLFSTRLPGTSSRKTISLGGHFDSHRKTRGSETAHKIVATTI